MNKTSKRGNYLASIKKQAFTEKISSFVCAVLCGVVRNSERVPRFPAHMKMLLTALEFSWRNVVPFSLVPWSFFWCSRGFMWETLGHWRYIPSPSWSRLFCEGRLGGQSAFLWQAPGSCCVPRSRSLRRSMSRTETLLSWVHHSPGS